MYELYVYMAQSFKKVVVSVLRGQTVFETFIYRAYFKASQKWSLFDMRSLSNGTKYAFKIFLKSYFISYEVDIF